MTTAKVPVHEFTLSSTLSCLFLRVGFSCVNLCEFTLSSTLSYLFLCQIVMCEPVWNYSSRA
jgi:hypothetical protein